MSAEERLAAVLAEHAWSEFHPSETCACGWVSDKYDASGCRMESAEVVTEDYHLHVAAAILANLGAEVTA